MIKKDSGFTLVELLITMAIFVLTIASVSGIFVPLLTQFKQQSKIAETQIQGLAGLEILRKDLEQAGFGLPWVIPDGVIYSEGSGSTTSPIPVPNDPRVNDAPSNPPRLIGSINNVAGLGGSDYLVIKATTVATNDTATKWTYVVGTSGGGVFLRSWGNGLEDLKSTDRVIVLIPMRGENAQRILLNNDSAFSVQFGTLSSPSAFTPTTEDDLYLVYGVDPDTDLRMPFNRADYYIRKVAGTVIPDRCAEGTGILMKSVINQENGNRGPGIPLLDCVADMQVVFRSDTDSDGTLDDVSDDISTLTAEEIRNQVKEVRVYILAHEGQKDNTFNYCPNPSDCSQTTLEIPSSSDPGYGAGRTFDFNTSGITEWRKYRWKVYTLVVKLNKTI